MRRRFPLVLSVALGLALLPPASAQVEGEAESFESRRSLAEQGNAGAQFTLGLTYRYGVGVPQDYEQAVTWYRLAAEQGGAEAHFNLGLMDYDGQRSPRDYRGAVESYRLAAEQGGATAQYGLGFIYANGREVPRDHVQAHMWFNLAAASGFTPAAEERDDLAEKMTPRQIAEAQRLAREWTPTEPIGN